LAQLLITLGVLFLLGLLTDLLGRHTPLPRVSLLILFGFAIGPSALGLLPTESRDWFPTAADFALVMVGFLLGSHFTFDSIRKHGKLGMLFSVAIVVAAVYGVELAAITLAYPALEPVTSIRPIAIAAAARTEPGERIGLFRDPQLLGGLAYYGHRRVAILETPEDARRFLDETGGPVVLKRRKLERISGETAIVSSARHGRREIVVVVDPQATTPRGDAPYPD